MTAAEVSGDRNAAGLAAGLLRLDPAMELEGFGGPAMAAAGVSVRRDAVGRATMGLKAFLRAREVAGLLKLADRMYRQNKPDLAVCVDSWTMNKHFAALAKKHGVPVFYYVAPQAWASREGRVKRLAATVDALGCILPFEEVWFRTRGVNATFVGHPLFDTLPRDRFDAARRAGAFPTIALLPGSRRGVARANFPRMLEVARRVRTAFPTATFLIPTTPATDAVVRPMVEGLDWFSVEPESFDAVLPRCDFALTVSGTATLHTAAWGVPMAVVYAGNPVLWHAVGRWLIRTRTFAMVNLLADRTDPADHLVPEFIPWYGPTAPAADAVIALLRSPEKLAAMRSALEAVVRPLDLPGAGDRAAALAMGLIPGGG